MVIKNIKGLLAWDIILFVIATVGVLACQFNIDWLLNIDGFICLLLVIYLWYSIIKTKQNA